LGDGVTPPPPNYYNGWQDNSLSLGQFLDEWCAYYMAIGMTRNEVMNGERDAFDDYDRAHEYRRVQNNQSYHLEGLYNYIALSCALSSAFAEKGKKGTPYPPYPIPLTQTEREAEKKRNIEKTLEWVKKRKRNA